MTTAPVTTTAPAAPATTGAPSTGQNLTASLSDVQLKQNIDALQKGGMQNADIQSYVNNYQKNADGSYGLKTGASTKPAVLNKNGVDVSSHPFNPLNTDSQATQTSAPAAAPGPGAFFLGSLGQGVKGTVNSLTAPIKGGINEVKTDTSQAFGSGVDQIKQGASNFGKGGDIIGPSLDIGAGIVNSAFSPLAAPMKPVGMALNAATEPLQNNKGFQNFADSKAGIITANALKPIANAGTIAQGALAFAGGPKVAEGGAAGLDTVAEPLKPGMTALKNDITTAAGKVADVKDAAQSALEDRYVNQAKEQWTKPTTLPKGFNKATQIFEGAADQGHNIADTLVKNKINVADNVTRGANGKQVFDTADTAENLRADAGKASKEMLRPSLQKADLTTPKTSVDDVIAEAKKNITKNNTLVQETKDSLLRKLNDTGDSLKAQHPDGMSLTNLHDEKIVRDANAKYDNVTNDPATNAEATKNKAVADAARKLVEQKAPADVPVKAFNKELTKQYQAANYLDALHGKNVPTGAFSKLANYGGKLAGLAAGHAVGGGILADVAGYHIGGAVERMFEGMSNPIKNTFLENLKETNPEAFDKVQGFLNKEGPTPEQIKAANTPANPNNLVSAGGTGGTAKEIPNNYGKYDFKGNRNTTYGTKLPPGTTLGAKKGGAFFPKNLK